MVSESAIKVAVHYLFLFFSFSNEFSIQLYQWETEKKYKTIKQLIPSFSDSQVITGTDAASTQNMHILTIVSSLIIENSSSRHNILSHLVILR